MPGTSGRQSDLADTQLDRQRWLAALARALRSGEYRPDCDQIAEALMRAVCKAKRARERTGR